MATVRMVELGLVLSGIASSSCTWTFLLPKLAKGVGVLFVWHFFNTFVHTCQRLAFGCVPMADSLKCEESILDSMLSGRRGVFDYAAPSVLRIALHQCAFGLNLSG